jgi:hypothetical protein
MKGLLLAESLELLGVGEFSEDEEESYFQERR